MAFLRILLAISLTNFCGVATSREQASHLMILEQPSSYQHKGHTRLEIRSNYSGTVTFVESNEFRILINTTADELEDVYRVKAELDEHNGGLLLQVYQKPDSAVWIQLEWIVFVIGGLTGLVFMVSCVWALCSYHSEHSRYDSIERKSYTSDSQRIVFRSRSSMHSSTQGEHILNEDGDNFQNDDTLKRVPELPDEEAAAEAIEMEELRRRQMKGDESDGDSDSENKNLVKNRYQPSSKKIHKEYLLKEKKAKHQARLEKEAEAESEMKDYLEYSSDGSETSDKEKTNKSIAERQLERQRIEGAVIRPRKEIPSTHSESELSRQEAYNKYVPFPISASMEQNKLADQAAGLSRASPKENLGGPASPKADDGTYPFLVQADVHLQNRVGKSPPIATSSPMSTFRNPARKVAFADPRSEEDPKSTINFQDIFDKFALNSKGSPSSYANMGHIAEDPRESHDLESTVCTHSAYSGNTHLVDHRSPSKDRTYMNVGETIVEADGSNSFKNSRPFLPPSLVAGARRSLDSSGNSLSTISQASVPPQGRNGQQRTNALGAPKSFSPIRPYDPHRSSLDSGNTNSSSGTLWQSSASSDTGNSSPPLPPPPDGYEEESGMQFDFPSPPQLYSPQGDDEEVQYQNYPARDKKTNGQKGVGKGGKMSHMTFMSIFCVLSVLTGVYCARRQREPRVDITIYTPRNFLDNTSTIFLHVDKYGEVLNEMQLPIHQYNIGNPILTKLYSDLCENNECEQGCDKQTGSCICKKGYKLDEQTQQCVDINECMEGGAVCHSAAGCLNKRGSYNCICSGEFYGDGKNCKQCKAPCVRGTYEYRPCGTDHQKICRACKTSCPKGFFMNKPCNMKHNAECKVCKPSKCSGSDFEYRMCTNSQDRECKDKRLLKKPMGSRNTIIETKGDIKDDTKTIEYLRPSDFIGLRTYIFDRGTGLKVEVRLTSLQASQLFVPVNYSSHQSDGLPPGAKLEDFRRYCPHPVPSYYKLFYQKHRNITYRIDENNQVQPCETYRMFGKFPTARNLKEQSFLAVEPGPITNIFEIKPTYFKYSTIWVHKSKRCMKYSDGCDNCTIQCVVKMKDNDECKVTGEDNDNGWSPRLQVCYNCCARKNCTEKCKEYHKKHCQSKNVECRRGTVVEFRVQPQWNTSQANYFFCHVQPKKHQKLLQLAYKVSYHGRTLHYKEIELDGDLKWESEGKMIHRDDILSILVDAKINHMPNFLEGEFSGNKEFFRVGVYKNSGSTVQSTVISGDSILVRPTKPFGLVGISSGEEAFSALLNSTVATEREVPYASNPDLMVVTVENASYPYIVTHKNAAPVLKLSLPKTVSLLSSVYEMASLKRKTINGDIRFNGTHWLVEVKGRLHDCPGLLKIDLINPEYPTDPLYRCDVAVVCPKTFAVEFAIPSNDDLGVEKEMSVSITDNSTTYHLRLMRAGESKPDIDQDDLPFEDEEVEATSSQPALQDTKSRFPNGVIFSIPFIASVSGAVVLLLFLAAFGYGLGLGSLPDMPVLRWFHVLMAVIYITFNFLYSLVATFTVFSLLLVIVNREPVSLVMDYRQQAVARSAIQHLQHSEMSDHLANELVRQNEESNRTKAVCLGDMSGIVTDIDKLHQQLLSKTEEIYQRQRIPDLIERHTSRVAAMLSQDLLSFKSKFQIYTRSLIEQINDDVKRSYNSIRQNSWLAGARFLRLSIENIRSFASKVQTKPFMQWANLYSDLSRLTINLTQTVPDVPDVAASMTTKMSEINRIIQSPERKEVLEKMKNIKIYNQWSSAHKTRTKNGVEADRTETEKESSIPVTFYAFLACMILVDVILFLHRFCKSVCMTRLLIFGYPEFIDCRSSSEKPMENDVFEEEKPKRRKLCSEGSACHLFFTQVFSSLFVPKSILAVLVCVFTYFAMVFSHDMLTTKSLQKLGLNYDTNTYQDLQIQMLNTRIVAHAHQINTVEYPSYLNWMSAYIERHKFALHLHQQQQRALGIVHNTSYCQYIQYLHDRIDCVAEDPEEEQLSVSTPGCKFSPVKAQLYSRKKSAYHQAATEQLESLLTNMKIVVTNTCQVITVFLSVIVLKELLGTVLWLYLKRSNRLRLRIIFEKDDTNDASVLNNTT